MKNVSDTVMRPEVSIIIPMFNEEDNVVPLYEELRQVMDESGLAWQAIFVDDGSWDQSVSRIRAAAGSDPRVIVIELARRFGQTAALAAGIRRSSGKNIVPLDADLQNDPSDIPRMIQALEAPPGYDIVSGWRQQRQDRLLTRRLPSVLANRLIARLTWTKIHDFGCSLKVYRREVLDDIELYGEMHRFLPAICQWRGARVTEVPVNHRPRIRGTSKYGLRRTIKVLLDLITVKFLGDYLSKPIYFFGKLGLACIGLATLVLVVALAQKFGYLTTTGEAINLNRNILVMLAMMLALVSVTFIMMGLLSELLVRIYHESQNLTPYRIRSITRGGHHANGQSASRVVRRRSRRQIA